MRHKTVLGNVEEGVAEIARAADALRRDQREVRRRAVARGHGQGARRTGPGPGSDRSGQRLGSRFARSSWRWTPCACRPPDADVDDAVRRRAPPRRLVPAAAAIAGSAAARRANEPSRCRIGRVARAVPEGLSGHRRRRDARSLLPRQRGRLDPRARSRLRHSLGRQLLVVARSKAAAARGRRKGGNDAGSGLLQRELELDRMSPRARAGQGQSQAQRVRRICCRRETAQKIEQVETSHSARSALRRHRRRSARPAQGVRRSPADGRRVVHTAARRHRRRDRPERRRQDDAVPDDHRARAAGWRHTAAGRDRSRSATSISARDALGAEKTVWEEITGGNDERASWASARWRREPTSRGSTSKVAISSGKSGRCRAASATASTSPSC